MNPRSIFFTLVVIAAAARMDAAPLMRDFIGINGHTVQFKPELYQPLASLVRDYHPVSWDLGTNTSQLPPFPFAGNRVDWSKVYGSWLEKGWRVDASLQIESIKTNAWENLEANARAYGRAIAKEFGPSGKRRLLESVEIGNEPGSFSDSDYTRVFRAMAEGIREGDPALRIATCNVTTGASGKYEKSIHCVAGLTNLFDVLNVHTYAQLENWPTWRRSYPEDPKLNHYLPDVEALCRWRDTHAPGKPVWITEFGYDSTTQPQDKSGTFAKWVGVTDEQQAQWLVRSVLIFSTMPVERAYIYFFNDADKPHVHGSSGVTRRFQPKPSFHAIRQLQTALGDYRFSRIITNTAGRVRAQEYVHGTDAKRTIWAVWAPTAAGHRPTEATFTAADSPGKLLRAERMPLTPTAEPVTDVKQWQRNGGITAQISGSPVYLWFER